MALTTTSDLEKKYSQSYGTGNSSVSSDGLASKYDNELSELARKGNYKSYFSKATQLANVNKLSQKYLQNSQRQQGIYGTGAGSSATVVANNAYLNASQDALSDYYANEDTITEDAYNTYQSDQASQVSEYENMLSQYTTLDGLQNAYAQLDTSGLSDEAKSSLESYYNNQIGLMNENTGATAVNSGLEYLANSGKSTSNIDDVAKWTLTRWDGTTQNLDGYWGVKNELNVLKSYVANGSVTSPTAFKLENKDGKGNTWIVYDPSTGTYYQTSEEIANKYFSNNSYLIKDKNLPTKYSAQ